MAQVGFTPIQLYSTSTAAAVPIAASLTNSTLGSELAINITDGKLFYKDNANAVQVIGWKTVPTTAGGTGLTTYTAGDLSYYASGTTFTKLAIGTAGQILTSTGTAPQWSTLSGVAVTTFSAGTTGFTPNSATSGAVTLAGTLVVSNGGTGLTSLTAGYIPYGNGTSAFSSSSSLYFNGTNLGVGTTSPGAKLTVSSAVASVATGQLVVKDPGYAGFALVQGGAGESYLWNLANNYVSFGANSAEYMRAFASGGVSIGNTTDPGATNLSVTGNVVIATSGKGIDFSATPGTGTSELFADYEEGTWTPVITPAAGAITSYTITSATYTKVGRLVMATTRFTITNAGTGTGALFVTLPFTIGSQNSSGSAIETTLTGDSGRVWGPSGDTAMNVARYNNTTLCVTNSVITATIIYSV